MSARSGADLDRRGFLAALPGAALLARAWRPPIDAIGVQLYTLRSVMAEDPAGTLARVAEIGYREVELAGLYGMSPARMRELLDGVGLRAASSHHGLDEIRGDWRTALEGAGALGQELVVCPSIPGGERSPEDLRRVADDFNRAGEAARALGLSFGYHNHDWELRPLADGTRPMDLLLERCDPGLVAWQMDVFWTVHGGADPLAYLEGHPGRVTSVHVKDRTADGDMVDVGRGVIDFATILRRAEGLGLRHAFVEHDRPGDPLDSVRVGFQAVVRALG